MSFEEKLKKIFDAGWFISEKGYNFLTENGSIVNQKQIFQIALNTDLKDFGSPTIETKFHMNKTGQVVLQIQKLRNVAAPKVNETSDVAPRMLKLILTDGHTRCQAIEISHIPGLSIEKSSPGIKLLLNNAQIIGSYILIQPSNCCVLGGKVVQLHEKWELSKNIKHLRNNTTSDGPPAWVNFGVQINSLPNINDNLKSLNTKIKKCEDDPKCEFNQQRKEAIAEATTGAVKKAFGGGSKQILSLQSDDCCKKSVQEYNFENMNSVDKNDRVKTKPRRDKCDEKNQICLEPVSLYDFLETKLSDTKMNYVNQNDLENYNSSAKVGHNNNTYSLPSNDKIPVESFVKNNESSQINKLSSSFKQCSVNQNFASRSLRQHLNMVTRNNNGSNKFKIDWKKGDQCLAKYWEDGKFYMATVKDVTETTCVVKYNDYGNIEEILKNDCFLPHTKHKGSYSNKNNRLQKDSYNQS